MDRIPYGSIILSVEYDYTGAIIFVIAFGLLLAAFLFDQLYLSR